MLELLFDNVPLVLLAAGLVLMALEAVSPGAHFIVVGVALIGAGAIGLLFPPAAAPLVLAGLALVFGVGAAWVYREFDFYGGKGQAQTSDSSSLPGRTGYVTDTVTPRSGEIKLDDGGFNPYYSARTTADVGEIEEETEVIVLDPGGGNVLTVVPFGALEEDEIDRALARETTGETDEERSTETGQERTDSTDDDRTTETESERT
ncbi:NfeD family protein [Natrialbaceae archaeon AArc-T1-2]|uniref:NfeD family protein n=1 Tax=Natrialbaceae archaeon AArc-T1-2 TaxID=3053904 RepID=UPI00255AA228|nr:NfeD family protein [Natrialbaceae archaeon AArc-T1-2]WIV65881.1 NfeD family protein [Natrialbaceae archaeon AArc-T1-2]